jgi:hypothetical protein
MDKALRRREFPAFVVQDLCIEGESSWHDANVDGKKKVTKQQRRSKVKDWREMGFFVAWKSVGV